MSVLPIKHITLYKHGVGFFERRAKVSGVEVPLTFRVEDMNDVLKSFTAIDWGGGQVLGVDYATPQGREELLAGCTIRLEDDRSLRDLIAGLRGRRVALHLTQDERMDGDLLGLDEPSERQPLTGALVSLLLHETNQVRSVSLERVEAVDILDERGVTDLRFFLEASLGQEQQRPVTVRLSPGEHDLSVSYVAPAPTWRVSYRLLMDGGKALLLGWGIFDNRLEEDLEGISLNLVAGKPISFIYDLYTPFTPDRPVMGEGQAETGAAYGDDTYGLGAPLPAAPTAQVMMARAVPAPKAAAERRRADLETFSRALPAQARGGAVGESSGELFQYAIQTPVSVRRGQSAMVPIVSARLEYARDLLYNSERLPDHPVAAARLKNATGLTLERGPVTVLDGGEYVGEAVLPFTPMGEEIVAPFAVELGVRVFETAGAQNQTHALHLQGAVLHIEEWGVRWREYRVNNATQEAVKVLIEHRRTTDYELVDTPKPAETTPEFLRFAVSAPARGETTLKVSERTLLRRVEDLHRVSYEGLRRYLQQGLIAKAVYERVLEVMRIWEKISDHERELKQFENERERIYDSQEQIRANMAALSETGKEGKMRAYYVDQLEASEAKLTEMTAREGALREEITQLNAAAQGLIDALV